MTKDTGGMSAEGSRSGDQRPSGWDGPWEAFEIGLGGYLSTMVDHEECDHLVIELPSSDPTEGVTPYAQFAAFGDGMVRAEICGDSRLAAPQRLDAVARRYLVHNGWAGNQADGSEDERNWHLEFETGRAAQAARDVVHVLRAHFGVVHPQLLTYQAWGPAAERAADLDLCPTEAVVLEAPVGQPQGAQLTAMVPADRDELVEMVRSVLAATFEEDPDVDDDGDFVLHQGGQIMWVRVRHDQPAVELMARVAHEVRSRRATAVEIGLLNRDNLWTRWVLRERDVWQLLMVPGGPFVPAHLDAMLEVFVQALVETRDDLVLRTGARAF